MIPQKRVIAKRLEHGKSHRMVWLHTALGYHLSMIKETGTSDDALYEGGPKKPGFSLKNNIYLHSEQKTLSPLQNTLH